MSWSRVSFASWSTISFPSMPQWLGTQQKRTQVPLSLNAQYERVVSIFAFNCLQARHWVRVDYDIVLYRIHVSIIIQCRCDCCCLSSKYGTVIWESFGQLAASRLTILEMAVDDRCCPHTLVNLRSVSVDFIMWSLIIVILSEFGRSLFSCDHIFAQPSMRLCLLGSYSCVPGGKVGVFRGQTISLLISADVMVSSTLRPMGFARGRVIPPFPFGLGR